ncbi:MULTISPECIES: DUF3024 domain-containing protein [Paenibacillus]|uniref:DUF3024 domain-containing protein n=1 Tax=Paenibacillus TaxID=44249 RepID=UPI0011A8104E|nr:DUF3024 domain-containing protein [Paenibacillus sp. IHBB 10380]
MDDFTKRRIMKIMDNYTKNKIPKHLQNQLKLQYKIRGNNITLIEERPAFMSEQWIQLYIAQFRLDQGKWRIYWRDSKEKWHLIDDIPPDEDFEKQLIIVDNDDRGMFWN